MNELYGLTMQNPIMQPMGARVSPDMTRLTLEQEYNRLSNKMNTNNSIPNESNPYNDYVNVLNSCSDVTKEKIITDGRFSAAYAQCEGYLKEYLYAQVIPQVLETQPGRIAFEQLYLISKNLKDEFSQKDRQKEKQLELLMQDEVVLKRLQELQMQTQQQPLEGNN